MTQESSRQPVPAPDAGSSALVGTTCMELALEGERLCKSGDLKNGVRFFEEAIKVGTKDDRTLSAIYSQLGNAYFYMEEYQKALDYHKQDVALVHRIGDEAAEAKACGNLGNTFKMLNKFDEAAVYCRRYLEISRKLQDSVGEGRALYNLGNVYHTQGKRMIGASEQESDPQLSNDIRACLMRAIEHYELNLAVVTKLQDFTAMGRAYGNLGNTQYLLGNFEQAVENHKKRLEIAKQTNDKSAERRAHLNLGNANVFLGNFKDAIDNYSATLRIAQELQDKYTEAHSCYSIANTYTFLRDYKSAITYHHKYLDMIKDFDDKLGEGRACWSLVNIYQMVNDPELALVYAKRHHEIAELLGDKTGLASAKLNIEELEEILAQRQAAQQACSGSSQQEKQNHQRHHEHQHHHHHHHHHHNNQQQQQQDHHHHHSSSSSSNHHHQHHHHQMSDSPRRLGADKRQEQEQSRFKRQLNSALAADIDGLAARRKGRGASASGPSGLAGPKGVPRSLSSERLFDMIAHFQSGRFDDQRCEMLMKTNNIHQARTADDKENLGTSDGSSARSSSAVAPTPGAALSRGGTNQNAGSGSSNDPEIGPSTGPKMTSQPSIVNPINAVSAAASAIKATYRKASLAAYPGSATQPPSSIQSQRRPTVSAEHREQLFDMIAGAQGQRMDEQRASMPMLSMANGAFKARAGTSNHLARGHTIDQAGSYPSSKPATSDAGVRKFIDPPETILETNNPNLSSNKPVSSLATTRGASTLTSTVPMSCDRTNRAPRLNRQYQTVDSETHVQDERFLDSLMKLQSTRFNDQRSEFPKKNQAKPEAFTEKEKGQADNFFNLIVKFQSGRIDDQRSKPPEMLNKDS